MQGNSISQRHACPCNEWSLLEFSVGVRSADSESDQPDARDSQSTHSCASCGNMRNEAMLTCRYGAATSARWPSLGRSDALGAPPGSRVRLKPDRIVVACRRRVAAQWHCCRTKEVNDRLLDLPRSGRFSPWQCQFTELSLFAPFGTLACGSPRYRAIGSSRVCPIQPPQTRTKSYLTR